MATVGTTVDQSVKPETITYGVLGNKVKTGTDAEGNDTYKTELKTISREKDLEAARKDGTLLFEQTFSYDRAGTVDGIVKVIHDPDEAVQVFNSGLKIRLNTRINALLTEVDDAGDPKFQPEEGTYDMRDTLNEPAQRKFLSPMEKVDKVLKGLNLTPEQVAQILANYATQPSPEASAE